MTYCVLVFITWSICLSRAAACYGDDEEVFIKSNQDFFQMSIRPDLVRDKDRYAAMGFAGSGTFLTTKGREKILLRPPEGFIFTTKQICLETMDARHILLVWAIDKKIAFVQKLFPRVKGSFDKVCFRPRKPELTQANVLKMMFRKTKAGDNYMSQKNIWLQICVPVPDAIEEVLTKEIGPELVTNSTNSL